VRICLLGEFSGNLDEAMRKSSFYVARELSKRNRVLPLDLRRAFYRNFWISVKKFRPQVIHYLHGPTLRSFILLKMITLYTRCNAKTVMFALRPEISDLDKRIISTFKPDIMLAQSYTTEKMFRRIGFRTKFLPVGIDIEKFKPVSEGTKRELRRKYGLDEDKFIILHIGSIKRGRNIQIFKKLQNKSNQVLIVGPPSTGINQEVYRNLVESGCLVWVKYIKDIEEIYALSDCYVYPTVDKYNLLGKAIADSIETPLSVLEAMSCNLPVITTRFGALPRIFEEGDGLIFVENDNDIFKAVEDVKNGIRVRTRRKVLPYSWESIVRRLEKIYLELIEEEN